MHKKKTLHTERHISDLGEIRTHDPRFRRPLLYPAELPNQFLNRTYSSIGKRIVDVNYFSKNFLFFRKISYYYLYQLIMHTGIVYSIFINISSYIVCDLLNVLFSITHSNSNFNSFKHL